MAGCVLPSWSQGFLKVLADLACAGGFPSCRSPSILQDFFLAFFFFGYEIADLVAALDNFFPQLCSRFLLGAGGE